jgi:hypothetical protein
VKGHRDAVTVKRVFGEPYQKNGVTVIPAAKVMGAAGFDTLSKHFADRTVVIYDPRGSEASVRTDGATQSTPDEHADDLHRIILALDERPAESSPAAAAR